MLSALTFMFFCISSVVFIISCIAHNILAVMSCCMMLLLRQIWLVLFPDEEELELESDVTSDLPDVSEAKFVDYDSEENEVVEPQKPQGRAVSEFFEDEAELSESEWDSADEDEQGLDTLDFEEGDAEKLDQRKVREQLDKIHM